MTTDADSDTSTYPLDEKQLRAIGEHAAAFNRAPAAVRGGRIMLGFFGACAALFIVFALMQQWRVAGALAAFALIAALARWVLRGILGGSPLYEAFLQRGAALDKSQWLGAIAGAALVIVALMATDLFGAVLAMVLVALAMAVALHLTLDQWADEQRRPPLEALRELLGVLRRNGIDDHEQRRAVCAHAGEDWEPCFEALFGYEAMRQARAEWPGDAQGRRRRRRGAIRDWLIERLTSPPAAATSPPTSTITAPPTPAAAPETATAPAPRKVAAELDATPIALPAPTGPAATIPGGASVQTHRVQRRIAAALQKAARRNPLAWIALRRTRLAVGATLVALCIMWMLQEEVVTKEDVSELRQQYTENPDQFDQAIAASTDTVKSRSQDSGTLRIPGVPGDLTDPVLQHFSNFRAGLAGLVLILCCFVPLPGLAVSSYAAALVIMFADRWDIPDIRVLGAGLAVLAAGVALALLRKTAGAVLPTTAPQGQNMQLLNARGQVVHGRGSGRGGGKYAIAYLRGLLATARRTRVSDIHLEPERGGGTIRMRVDGSMIEAARVNADLFGRLLNLVKILCDLDIARPGVVQDGSFRTAMADGQVDYRASFAPVAGSQKLVIRVLDPAAVPQHIDDLKMPTAVAERVAATCTSDAGMLLVCGPTGSGKTTTLYAALGVVDINQRNVITIEDPVEYHREGVTQTSVDEAAGNSFPHLLRSALRQDPDVILVGEIRDSDTATTAMRAAMTGHLVLSTLHANDAISAVARLVDLGVDANLMTSSLQVVIVQRLVRELCPKCKARRRPDPPVTGPDGRELPHVFEPRGCGHCLGAGFRGRRALYEMLLIDDAVKDAIHRAPTVGDLWEAVQGARHLPMSQAAWQAVADGVTTVDEIHRVGATS